MAWMRLITACLLAIAILAPPAMSQSQPPEEQPVLFKADEITRDEELGAVVARGNVEITQGNRILLADSVSYNEKSDTVSASGNVRLLEPTGEVLFADYVELTDNFKNGTVKQLRILLADESRFSAAEAQRRDGNLTIMRKAAFSPCKPCKKDPKRPLVWQLTAERIDHDQTDKEIRYRNAFLELFGFPVFYVPYFAHPDPTVKRKSGFLTPDFGAGGNTGGFVRAPYFIVLDKDKDATLAPIYTVEEGLVMSGEYRQRFNKGEVKVFGSITQADRQVSENGVEVTRKDRIRGHGALHARYDFNETWRAGTDLEGALDRTYLRRFNFFKEGGDVLSSRVYAEGFRRRSYFSAEGLAFQELRSGDRPEQPSIAPLFRFSHLRKGDSLGGRLGLEAEFRSLYRGDGPKTQRVSIEPGYRISHTTDMGIVTTLSGTVRGDLYYVDQTSEPDVSPDANTGVTGRFLPRLTLGARYPFTNDIGSTRLLVEPITMFTAALNGQNPDNIPNEDSTVFEADDTNLLSEDRLPGGDRVESGQRAIYGLKLGAYGPYDAKLTAFIGQSYRLHTDSELFQENRIERHFSDIVGRVDISPNPYIDVLYRFAMDRNNLRDIKRNQIDFRLGPPALRFSGSYAFVEKDGNFPKREEVNVAASMKITDYWSISGSSHWDLAENLALKHSAGLRYEDECLLFELVGTRSFFKDEDVEPSDSLLFRIKFKYLGEAGGRSE
jgi:LPS-assembly protein